MRIPTGLQAAGPVRGASPEAALEGWFQRSGSCNTSSSNPASSWRRTAGSINRAIATFRQAEDTPRRQLTGLLPQNVVGLVAVGETALTRGMLPEGREIGWGWRGAFPHRRRERIMLPSS